MTRWDNIYCAECGDLIPFYTDSFNEKEPSCTTCNPRHKLCGRSNGHIGADDDIGSYRTIAVRALEDCRGY